MSERRSLIAVLLLLAIAGVAAAVTVQCYPDDVPFATGDVKWYSSVGGQSVTMHDGLVKYEERVEPPSGTIQWEFCGFSKFNLSALQQYLNNGYTVTGGTLYWDVNHIGPGGCPAVTVRRLSMDPQGAPADQVYENCEGAWVAGTLPGITSYGWYSIPLTAGAITGQIGWLFGWVAYGWDLAPDMPVTPGPAIGAYGRGHGSHNVCPRLEVYLTLPSVPNSGSKTPGKK